VGSDSSIFLKDRLWEKHEFYRVSAVTVGRSTR
jgi:hypothetical protein